MPPPQAWRRALRASRAVVAFTLLILLALWSGIAFNIRREREDALRHAAVNLGNLARAFSEHTAKTLEGADQAIRFARSAYLDQGAALDLHDLLERKRIIGSAYHLLSVIGPDGFVSHSSQPYQRVDLRDREHFRVHAQGQADTLFISKPVLGRVSGKWSIQLTRRIDAADGAFGGVVVLSLSPSYLTRFYGDVDLGSGGAISLVGFDGVVRARAARGSEQGAQDIRGSALFRHAMQARQGTVRMEGAVDHVERLWAFRALDDYGLLVFTGQALDDILQEPARRERADLWTAAVLSAVIVLFAGAIVRRTRLQLQLVDDLRHSRHQAEAANRLKTRFLASVSHALRTPLNGILGYAELIREGSSPDECREFGGIVHDNAQRLHGMVGAILDLARIESGGLAVQPEPVALPAVLDELAALFAEAARDRGMRLWVDAGDTARMALKTDRARLLQVLRHLVDNALRFGREGGCVVVAARGPLDGRVEIEVRDDGPGIAPGRLGSLFNRFDAAAADFTHPAQGAGLGLPLAFELSQLLGGSLRIASQPGQGTMVTLELPLGSPAAAGAH